MFSNNNIRQTAINFWSACALVTMDMRFATEITILLTACQSTALAPD